MTPIPRHFEEQIESERLVIRTARPGDGIMFNAALIESQAALSPWLAWMSPPPTVAQSEARCCEAHARFLAHEDWMVLFIAKVDGTLVGGSGLHDADWALRQFEVGYWGRTTSAGQGLVTEGVRALADHAMDVLQANRVFLTTDVKNLRSWRLAERAGFQFEGTLRRDRLDVQGRLRDTKVYSRVSQDALPDGVAEAERQATPGPARGRAG